MCVCLHTLCADDVLVSDAGQVAAGQERGGGVSMYMYIYKPMLAMLCSCVHKMSIYTRATACPI